MFIDIFGFVVVNFVLCKCCLFGDCWCWVVGVSVLVLVLLWWVVICFGWVDVLFLLVFEQFFEVL